MYKTIQYMTCNENGNHEVEIVYEKGFWRWLLRMSEKKEIYISIFCDKWYKKETGIRASSRKEYEIRKILRSFK